MSGRRRSPVGSLVIASVAVVVLPVGACSGPPDVERDPEPLMQTSALRYPIERHDIGYSTTIPFTYRNETSVEVVVDHCEGDVRPLLQIRRDDRWVDQWRPFMDACESPPLRLAPGERYHDTLRVVGAPPGSNVTPAFVFEDVEGVYRLYWFRARLTDPDAEAAALPWRVSNAFVLELP